MDLEAGDAHRVDEAKPVAIQPHLMQTVLIEQNYKVRDRIWLRDRPENLSLAVNLTLVASQKGLLLLDIQAAFINPDGDALSG